MITEQVLPQAPDTLERLEAGGDILDVGAGAGHHVVHYALRFPSARVVGLEPDLASVELARQAVVDADVGDRVEFWHADASGLDEPGGFDLVTMNVTLHETGDWDDYENVLDCVRRALKPGGTLVVSELPYPDSPAEYRQRTVYKMLAGQLHEALVGCGMITQCQLPALLEGAGFDRVRVADQSMPTRFVVLAAKGTDS
jgi:ubiquinone/menaquinone biosynthesis C-methylase UbiE